MKIGDNVLKIESANRKSAIEIQGPLKSLNVVDDGDKCQVTVETKRLKITSSSTVGCVADP